jgi:hypothetical protein
MMRKRQNVVTRVPGIAISLTMLIGVDKHQNGFWLLPSPLEHGLKPGTYK